MFQSFGVLITLRRPVYARATYTDSYVLQSKLLQGGYVGIIWGIVVGAIKGHIRSLDYSSYKLLCEDGIRLYETGRVICAAGIEPP